MAGRKRAALCGVPKNKGIEIRSSRIGHGAEPSARALRGRWGGGGWGGGVVR